MDFLGQVAGDGAWVSVAAITALGGAVAAAIKAHRMGIEKGQGLHMKIKPPVPTISTREEPQYATRSDLVEYTERAEKQMAALWSAIDGERKIAREALGKIHQRLDAQTTATAGLQGTVDEVRDTVGKLLDLALQRKPGGRAG